MKRGVPMIASDTVDAGPADLPPPPPDCATSRLEATAAGILVTNDCGAEVVLAPRVLVDGAWAGEACGYGSH